MKGQRKSSCPFFPETAEENPPRLKEMVQETAKEPPVKGGCWAFVQAPSDGTAGLCLGNHLGSPSKVPFCCSSSLVLKQPFFQGLLGERTAFGAGISAAA